MSDPQQAVPVDAPAAAAGASPVIAFLTNVKTIAGLVVAIVVAVATISESACKLPFISNMCQESPPIETSDSSPPDWEAQIEKRVAALNVPRDTSLESVKLYVWHQPSKTAPLVEDVIVGLRAAGFNVKEGKTDLSNVNVDDRTPASSG